MYKVYTQIVEKCFVSFVYIQNTYSKSETLNLNFFINIFEISSFLEFNKLLSGFLHFDRMRSFSVIHE